MLNTLECKHCHAPLPKDALLRNDEIIVCEYCDTVHHMAQEQIDFPEKPKRKEKEKRGKPEKFTLNKLDDGVEINYRWLGKQHTGLLFFAVIWNAFILFFTFMMLFGEMEGDDPGLFIFCFLTPFYAVGTGMAWYVLAGFMNRTRIRIRRGGIDTLHSPIPMIGTNNHNVTKDDVAQVYCRRRVAYTSNDVPVHVYDVHYVKQGGDDFELVKGLDQLNKALYIEQSIERLYNIDDRPVDGEYRSPF